MPYRSHRETGPSGANVVFFATSRAAGVVGSALWTACEPLGARVVVLSRALAAFASDVAAVAVFDLSGADGDPNIVRELTTALQTFEAGRVLAVIDGTRTLPTLWPRELVVVLPYTLAEDDPSRIENADAFLPALGAALADALGAGRARERVASS